MFYSTNIKSLFDKKVYILVSTDYTMFDKLKKAIGIDTKKQVRSPTLDTIRMVDGFIRENSGKLKKTEVFKKLPKKVMWQTYQVIINYLEEIKKITTNDKGFLEYVWNETSSDKNTENI